MKRLLWIVLVLTLFMGCAAEKEKIELPATQTGGAPKYEGVEEGSTEEAVQVEFVYEDAHIVCLLPTDWKWEADAITEDAYALGISFWPENETEGRLRLQYYPTGFGVCGTGLEEEEIAFASGLTGLVGYYDGRKAWSFIGFYPEYRDYALTVDGAAWVMDYEEEILQILDTVQLG